MITIDVAADFSRYPAGRVREDGPYSGQAFREEYLFQPLQAGEKVTILLDGTRGYGSSFLEEVFGGLIRAGIDKQTVANHLTIISDDEALKMEIEQYIVDADE